MMEKAHQAVARIVSSSSRRALFAAAALPFLPDLAEAQAQPSVADEWRVFLSRYGTSDGRIIDTANGGISHSEGQGTGLLIATAAGDLSAFERILEWTFRNLQRPTDMLSSWRFQPDASIQVSDRNNATDGDILIAWALQRAAVRFGRPAYAGLAAGICRDILQLCTRRVGQRLILLPGSFGFEQRGHVQLNPSYYIFPALADFNQLLPRAEWNQLAAAGRELCRSATFGRWSLPADWVDLPTETGAPPRLARDKPARFSWDAVRVPLNLAWGGFAQEPALRAAAAFWTDPVHDTLPAWVDLRSDRIAPYPGHAGIRAVSLLATAACDLTGRRPTLPCVAAAPDYYGAALTLMVRLASQELYGAAQMVASAG